MDNTNYSSVHGLNDEKNVSCAVDIRYIECNNK